MSLKAYKKGELKEMLQKLNISAEGLKNELEDKLQNFLDAAGKSIEDVPELSEYFSDLPVSPTAVRKAARKSIAHAVGEDSDTELKSTQMISDKFGSMTDDMEISPSKVAQWATDTKKKMLNTKLMPKSVTKNIPVAANTLRTHMSQVTSVAGMAVATEAIILSQALIPINYEIKFGGFGAVTLPDLYIALFGNKFWWPASTWILFQILPLIVSLFINPRADSVSKRYRKAHALEYTFDPVVFAIAKMLLIYVAFETSALSNVGIKDISTLEYAVGRDTFMISAGVTLLFSIYEAVL